MTVLQASSTHRDAQERRAIACTDCVTRRATSKMKFQIYTICFYNPFFFFFSFKEIICSREFSKNFHLITGNATIAKFKLTLEILLSNSRNGKEIFRQEIRSKEQKIYFFHSDVFLSTEAINSFQYYFNSPRSVYKRGANSRFMVEISIPQIYSL